MTRWQDDGAAQLDRRALSADGDLEDAPFRVLRAEELQLLYYFGSLAMLVLVMQIVTGIFLTMHYKPDAAQAFASVEYIMRDVDWGWAIRYMHSTARPCSSWWCTCTCFAA